MILLVFVRLHGLTGHGTWPLALGVNDGHSMSCDTIPLNPTARQFSRLQDGSSVPLNAAGPPGRGVGSCTDHARHQVYVLYPSPLPIL